MRLLHIKARECKYYNFEIKIDRLCTLPLADSEEQMLYVDEDKHDLATSRKCVHRFTFYRIVDIFIVLNSKLD